MSQWSRNSFRCKQYFLFITSLLKQAALEIAAYLIIVKMTEMNYLKLFYKLKKSKVYHCSDEGWVGNSKQII